MFYQITLCLFGCMLLPGLEACPSKAPTISLIKAAETGDVDAVSYHLKHGADVNMQNSYKWTTLMYAAVRRGTYEKVPDIYEVLRKNPDLNIQDEDGETALMIAAKFGYVDEVRALLAANANRQLRNKEGKTAKMLAQENGHPSLADEILD